MSDDKVTIAGQWSTAEEAAFGPYSPILPVPVDENTGEFPEPRLFPYIVGCPAWLHNGEARPAGWGVPPGFVIESDRHTSDSYLFCTRPECVGRDAETRLADGTDLIEAVEAAWTHLKASHGDG